MAILDKTRGGGHWIHRGPRLHVRAVQGLRSAVAQVESLQQSDLCSELPRHRQKIGGEELFMHAQLRRQRCRGGASSTDRYKLSAGSRRNDI